NIAVEQWHCIQHEQQHLTAAAVRRNERSGVITLTRQEFALKVPISTPHHRPLQRNEYSNPRRQYGKARARTQNTLVTNNTVQAIASPTTEHHHHNLLQQHDNAISINEQIANAQPQALTNTQILILLPDGNQQVVNMNVPHGTSLSELLEQVGLHVDGNALPAPDAPGVEVSTEEVGITTIANGQLRLEFQYLVNKNESAVSSSTQNVKSPTPAPKMENIFIKQEEPPDIKPVIKE
ncbi:hypothetical protein L9F63_006974, partial [Diploptera punctata]